jgi:two-component system sensor histidine kinase HydH
VKKKRSGRRARELTPEERAYKEAQRLAARKVAFVRHLVPYLFTVLLLLFITRNFVVPGIVALAWGVFVTSHFFQVFVAPGLRQKWTRQEVQRQLQKTVSQERRLLQGQQQRSMEELSASIAHEIRNPITAAKSLVQQMGEDPSSGENVEYARVALEELDRVERSISHLLRYAREEGMDVEAIQLSELLEGALETFRDRLAALGVEVQRELDSDGEMRGDPEKLRRVLINLIRNALDALEEAGTPEPRMVISLGENLAGTGVWMSVKDNGPGIDEEEQAKIFRPFFSSKPEGTGLGLAISRKLVDAHNGTLEVNSIPGKGSEFVLTFPKDLLEAGKEAKP